MVLRRIEEIVGTQVREFHLDEEGMRLLNQHISTYIKIGATDITEDDMKAIYGDLPDWEQRYDELSQLSYPRIEDPTQFMSLVDAISAAVDWIMSACPDDVNEELEVDYWEDRLFND